jgi:hypothetical protein
MCGRLSPAASGTRAGEAYVYAASRRSAGTAGSSASVSRPSKQRQVSSPANQRSTHVVAATGVSPKSSEPPLKAQPAAAPAGTPGTPGRPAPL